MRMTRIHVDASLQVDAELCLLDQAAAHVSRVLRLGVGDGVVLFNGDGSDYPAELIASSTREVRVRVFAVQANSRESPLRIELAQALARGEKMDWIVQKATELGVTRIIPLITERSEVKLDETRASKRLQHWRAVAIGACEQSGRAIVPAITAVQSLGAWLAALDESAGARLALVPGATATPRTLDAVAGHALLAVGPEGGFGENDLALLRDANFRGLAIGPRVLRTETAGIAALAALQALYGDV